MSTPPHHHHGRRLRRPGADAYRASVDLYGEDEAAAGGGGDASGCGGLRRRAGVHGWAIPMWLPTRPHHPSPPPSPYACQVCMGTRMGSRRRPTAAMRTNRSVVCDAPGVCYDVTTPPRCYVPRSIRRNAPAVRRAAAGATLRAVRAARSNGSRHVTPHLPPHIPTSPYLRCGLPVEWDVEAQMP